MDNNRVQIHISEILDITKRLKQINSLNLSDIDFIDDD
jgi:hypothetical protein